MSKIIQAVNSMISNANKITDVLRGQDDGEIFFLYKGKYKWSIKAYDGGDYFLYYYPNPKDALSELASIDEENWTNVELTMYSTKDIKTQEAKETFRELFLKAKEKLYGMDKVLDDIINDDII
jgi:hypothetical protein